MDYSYCTYCTSNKQIKDNSDKNKKKLSSFTVFFIPTILLTSIIVSVMPASQPMSLFFAITIPAVVDINIPQLHDAYAVADTDIDIKTEAKIVLIVMEMSAITFYPLCLV